MVASDVPPEGLEMLASNVPSKDAKVVVIVLLSAGSEMVSSRLVLVVAAAGLELIPAVPRVIVNVTLTEVVADDVAVTVDV